jgi:hypothetical protein
MPDAQRSCAVGRPYTAELLTHHQLTAVMLGTTAVTRRWSCAWSEMQAKASFNCSRPLRYRLHDSNKHIYETDHACCFMVRAVRTPHHSTHSTPSASGVPDMESAQAACAVGVAAVVPPPPLTSTPLLDQGHHLRFLCCPAAACFCCCCCSCRCRSRSWGSRGSTSHGCFRAAAAVGLWSGLYTRRERRNPPNSAACKHSKATAPCAAIGMSPGACG